MNEGLTFAGFAAMFRLGPKKITMTKADAVRLAEAAQVVSDEITRLRAENARLREAMKNLLSRMERNECHHENTHRGGIIWTICDDCGGKWADDQGGFKPYCEPAEITNARAALGETQ
jgi:hypothetical protein